MTLDYAAALAALQSLEGRGMRLGLDRTTALLNALGNPHRGLRGALVAGTNGKGSVCALVESMARAAGLRTVMLTKPHLLSWCERIAVDGVPIPQQRFADLVATVLAAAATLEGDLALPTVFEVLTAAGLLAARQAEPDVLVCEVGLGGRLDSTNVVDLGVAVVTGIALDHRQQLGDDIAGIAAEKAGILKTGNDVVTAATGVALEVIRATAERVGTRPVTAVGTELPWRGEVRGRGGVAVDLEEPPVHLESPLIGRFQERNLAVAAYVARALRGRGTLIPEAAIVAGARTVRWPGRMQWIDGRPALLVDGCHNAEAVGAMVEAAAPLCSGTHAVMLFGAMADKDTSAMLDALRPFGGEMVFTQPAGSRAASARDLAAAWGRGARVTATVAEGVAVARELAGAEGVVVAGGSLYLAGEVLEVAGGVTGDPWIAG